MKRFIISAGIVLFLFLFHRTKAQEFSTRLEMEFKKEFLKDFDFSIVPEFRFFEDFTLDEYMVDGVLDYKLFKFLEFSAAYRYNVNLKDKDNEVLNRFAFSTQGKKEINRFETSLRFRVTNYIDPEDEDDAGWVLRPRFKLEYDIDNNKITPFTSYELFRNAGGNGFYKGRLDVGAKRNVADYHRVGLYYRLHDYFSDKLSQHNLGIEYRFKF
ncbi:MAG: DUF2490 domain-containing protein [Prolixibacteraceae bacterium]